MTGEAEVPVSSMDRHVSLTCLGRYVGLKRKLQVGNLGPGSEQGGGNTETVVACTFPGFSARSWKVHIRTWLVRTGERSVPQPAHLSGCRPIRWHAALKLTVLLKHVRLYRRLVS